MATTTEVPITFTGHQWGYIADSLRNSRDQLTKEGADERAKIFQLLVEELEEQRLMFDLSMVGEST